MGFWTAVVVIVIVCVVFGTVASMYQARLKSKSASKGTEVVVGDFEARLKNVEKRMANIETIVLEKEKAKTFDSFRD
ncbi:MAG: hypothetical protein JRH15_07685 [Deltaproteobacteria bacterium]|nr:hypothetical protein [Deltaproteobacteria bacterium]